MIRKLLLPCALAWFSPVLHAAAPPPSPPAWQVSSLVTADDVAPATAIAVGFDDQPIVAYVDAQGATRVPPTAATLRVLRGDGYGWRRVASRDIGTIVPARVALLSGNVTLVAYHDDAGTPDGVDDRVRVLRLAGDTLVDDAPPAIAAADAFAFTLSRFGSTAWLLTREPSTDTVRLSTREANGAWQTRSVPVVGSLVDGLAIVDDGNSRLHVAYSSVVANERGLRHLLFDGETWTPTTLRASGVAPGPIAMAPGPGFSPLPGILFPTIAPDAARVELLRFDGTTWQPALIEAFPASTVAPRIVAFGFHAPDNQWLTIHRLPSGTAGASPYRYGVLAAFAATATVADFGVTPDAVLPPADDWGDVVAVLGRGDPRALLHRPAHGDLDYAPFAPNWRVRHVVGGETGFDRTAGATIARDALGRPIGASVFGSSLIIRHWRDGTFVSTNLSNGTQAIDPDIAVARDGGEVVAFHGRIGNDLLLAHRIVATGAWSVTTLDSVGDVGRDARVHVGVDDRVFVAALDRTLQRAVLRVGTRGGTFARYEDVEAPPTGTAPGRVRSALYEGTLDDGRRYARALVAYVPDVPFASAVRTLEVELIDGVVVGSRGRNVAIPLLQDDGDGFLALDPAFDIAIADDGRAWLAVSQRGGVDERRVRLVQFDVRAPFAQALTATADDGFAPRAIATEPRDIRIGLRRGDPNHARVVVRAAATSQRDTLVHYVRGRSGANAFGEIEVVSGRIDLDTDGGDFLTWIDPALGGNALELAHLVSSRFGGVTDPVLPWDGGVAAPVVTSGLVCECLVEVLACQDEPTCYVAGPCAAGFSLASPAHASTPALANDLGALGEPLRTHFAGSEGGRYYLGLWATHGDEIIAMTRADPLRFARRVTTYATFAPGLRALVDGAGDTHRMTPAMLAQARDVWRDWANAGSPALRATIEAELDRLDDLAVFDGMTFAQWFAALTPGAGGDSAIFVDGFE